MADDLAEQSYPVMVEVTEHRLIWVEAESQSQAVAYVDQEPSEYLHDNQPHDYDFKATAPDQWDWTGYIYTYAGLAPNNDAHVQTHKTELWRRELAVKKAACITAGHPNTQTYHNGNIWCPGCQEYLVRPEDVQQPAAGTHA